mmetsp:Transcript_19670/g.54888  ORF Transcript_19670/g.54888 Transcript_19670/m.54888 type:complete len:244 (-) Transcript_19670:142-873(-)
MAHAVGHIPSSYNEIIVELDLDRGVACQVGLHLDGSIHLRLRHCACGIEGACQPLHHIHKDLIAPALAIRSVCVQHTLEDPCRSFLKAKHLIDASRWRYGAGLIQHKHLERIRGGGLGVAVVDDLIQQLVHQHKVFADSIFRQHATVILDDDANPPQELQHKGGGHVGPCRGYHLHSTVLDMEVRDAIYVEHRGRFIPFLPKFGVTEKRLCGVLGHIPQVVAPDDHVPPGAEDEELREHTQAY